VPERCGRWVWVCAHSWSTSGSSAARRKASISTLA